MMNLIKGAFGLLGRVVNWVVYAVGLLVVVVLVGLWAGSGKGVKGEGVGRGSDGDGGVVVGSAVGAVAGDGAGKPAEVEAAAVQSGPGETAARGDGQAGCLCSAGASCVGPRGGVYCVSDAGSKRYLKGQ